jgi:hypothetical protein
VWLTVDSRVQRAAEEALSGYRGAVVAIDPGTGAVLAMASSPAYNPASIDDAWDALVADGSAPLYDRASQSLYPPGSTFKIVTLTGALSSGVASAETTYGPGPLEIGGAPVTNYGRGQLRGRRRARGDDALDQHRVRTDGCRHGPQELVAQSERFGFNRVPPVETPARASLMPVPGEMTTWETAWAGVGQPVGEHESPPGPQSQLCRWRWCRPGSPTTAS